MVLGDVQAMWPQLHCHVNDFPFYAFLTNFHPFIAIVLSEEKSEKDEVRS
jgi:hypothetical protein